MFVCFDNQNDSLFFRPMSLQRERLRAHECVVVVVVEEFVVMVANDRHVHYNHHNASSFAVAALGRPVHPADCFSFCLDLLAHILVHLVSPEKCIHEINKPKRVSGLQVRCRELDIFKIRNFLRNCLEVFWIFSGF